MKKINLYWYKSKKGANFGDELSKYIIEKISPSKVIYAPIPASKSRIIIRGARQVINGQIDLKSFAAAVRSLFYKNYLLSIGSILGWACSKNAIIWGSGIIRKNDIIQNGKFLAVRGKYSQKRLSELGISPPEIIGDPAILLPLIYNKEKVEKKHKIGIIPHYTHNHLFTSSSGGSVKIINLLDDIEKIIDDILSCEKTVSTSLHGLIVSHTYNIPSIWIKLKNHPIGGDDVKFYDYLSSVNIKEYAPFEVNSNVTEIVKLFDSEAHFPHLLPKIDIISIQKKLLQVAPFKLKKHYSNFSNS